MTNIEPTITFHGAAGTVTGSCMEVRQGDRAILIDCGLFQGPRTLEALNREPFSFDVRKVAAVVLTHAHIDHSGLLPKLVAEGFRGPIYGFSNTGEGLLADQLGPAGAGVVVVRVVPKSDNAKMAVARELQADLAQAKMGKPNVYLLEGYIAARVFTEALRRIPAKDAPNRARLKKSIDALDDLSIGGFRVHFTEERVGSKLVELSLIDSQGRVRE